MKKFLLTISAVVSFLGTTMAQAPDFSFETWGAISPPLVTVEDPQGWASLNALTFFGTTQSTYKETVSPFAGLASCKITTVKVVGASIPNPFRPGKNFDTAGFAGIGKIVVASPPSIKFGYSYAGRPAVLSFASKYTPVGGDSAYVAAYLTHWNGTAKDTIATGLYATGTATTTYAANSITMSYKPAFSTVMADTMFIIASSSLYQKAGAQIGSTFYVDNFAWSGWNSVNDINGVANNVSVFPNPSTDIVNIQSSVNTEMVEVLDITGRVLGIYSTTNNRATVSTAEFASGIYLFNVLNDKKEVISRGKFEVTK